MFKFFNKKMNIFLGKRSSQTQNLTKVSLKNKVGQKWTNKILIIPQNEM